MVMVADLSVPQRAPLNPDYPMVVEILSDAAKVIRQNGHTKGQFWPGAGDVEWRPGLPVCAVGALRVAVAKHGLTGKGMMSLVAQQAIRGITPGRPFLSDIGVLAEYNDRAETTAEDVVSRLETAAQDVRALHTRVGWAKQVLDVAR